jgi:hypothetical protein
MPNRRLDTDEFIRRATAKHGGRYDYSRTEYFNCASKVSVTCREHGPFEQRPALHTSGSGCPECAEIARRASRDATIKRARLMRDEQDGAFSRQIVRAVGAHPVPLVPQPTFRDGVLLRLPFWS